MGGRVLHSKAVLSSGIFLLAILSVPFLLQGRCIPGPPGQFFESETPVAAYAMFPVEANGVPRAKDWYSCQCLLPHATPLETPASLS